MPAEGLSFLSSPPLLPDYGCSRMFNPHATTPMSTDNHRHVNRQPPIPLYSGTHDVPPFLFSLAL
jgi:hypothetical protein